MPAVEGFTFSYETTTTDAGLVIPVCTNSAGSLLLALCMADTGSLTTFTATPPTGWAILEEWLNTTPVIVYMKIAGASEGDLTISATTHATTSETYNGSMISIRDVDQNMPVGTASLSSYSESNQDGMVNIGDGTTTGIAQSFATPAATANTNARGCFARAKFYLKKVGNPTGNIVAKLYAHSGTMGATSVPTGSALATSNSVSASSLTGTLTLTDFVFPAAWYQFAANTNYVIAMEYSSGDASNYVQVGVDNSTPGHAGNSSTFAAAAWAPLATRDVCFYAQRFSANMSNMAAAARTAMAQITTDRNNALVLYAAGGSGSTGTPMFVEGPVTEIHGSDGSAESHALGWTVQSTAGATPNNVYCSMSVTGASVKSVVQVNPPSSGATAIPAYVSADLCQYIDPIQGTTGFNSNTGLAATADTNFGTSLGGVTANDATVAAMTDKGVINSFHSLGGLTNAASAGQVSGAELVLAAANRFNLGTKNLLCHAYLSTPSVAQVLSPVSSGRGAWMGVRSNTGSGGATTGYKIYQVHGVGTKWGASDYVPILINAGASAGLKASSGTLDAAVIASVGFWVSAIGSLTGQVGFGSLWLMDTTTVCGGSAAEPVDAAGLVRAVGTGKERFSAKLQGANQVLLLQMVQFGDGGTNPLIVDLSDAAVEFPRQYNLGTAEVNYNSLDDKVGFVFYPGSGQVIRPAKVTSSKSRFYFGLHASASTSATYDFANKAVVGAGTVALNKAITISTFTISDYSSLDLSNATFDGGTIDNTPTSSNSLTVNASTNIDNSSLDVSNVTAGNYWCSVTDPSIFSGNVFVGGGGHAIRITTPGTYAFSGNTFTGFGADGGDGAAIYNDSGGAVTLNITGGGTPTVRNGSGASTTVNNNVSVTITGLQNPSEVRVFNAGTTTERSGTGAENVTFGSHTFSLPSGTAVDISILSLGYQNKRFLNYSTTTDASFPASQVIDRQYINP